MINPNAYYTVQGWMISELGLKGNALAAYAIIYGFSQDGASEYSGSARYLCEWLGCSRSTVMEVLKKLTETGLLVKREIYKNGVMFCTYTAAPRGCPNPGQGVQKSDRGCPIPGQGGDQFPDRGCPIPGHNNTRDNTREINIEIEREGAGAPPAPDRKSQKVEKEPKHKYGEYKNVLLTDKELAKLQEEMPDLWQNYVEQLSAYMASTGKKYKNHLATIRNWRSRDKKQIAAQPRPAARGGYPGAMVGPNGIPIDPTKNDLDGQF